MDTNDYHAVNKSLSNSQCLDMDVKLRKVGDDMHLRLEHELKIRTFL